MIAGQEQWNQKTQYCYGKLLIGKASKEDFQYHFESILSPDGMNGSSGIYAGRVCVYTISGIFIEMH